MLGFGKGKMSLVLDKTNFKFGETINGKAKLELNEPVKARGVTVYFYGIEKTSYYSDGRRQSDSRTVNRIEVKLEEGEKEYSSKEYEFEIGIPQYASGSTGAKLELGPLSLNLGGKTITVKWFLEAKLDIPMGFDVAKKIQLNIV
jgi:hypothetical protein